MNHNVSKPIINLEFFWEPRCGFEVRRKKNVNLWNG